MESVTPKNNKKRKYDHDENNNDNLENIKRYKRKQKKRKRNIQEYEYIKRQKYNKIKIFMSYNIPYNTTYIEHRISRPYFLA